MAHSTLTIVNSDSGTTKYVGKLDNEPIEVIAAMVDDDRMKIDVMLNANSLELYFSQTIDIFSTEKSMLDVLLNDEMNIDDFKYNFRDCLSSPSTQTNNTQTTSQTNTQSSADHIVTIVFDYEKHKLRATGNDGVHGEHWVQFPNHLRNREGEQYYVDTLYWTGKFYRVSGDIEPI
jgi:hypothetical protein